MRPYHVSRFVSQGEIVSPAMVRHMKLAFINGHTLAASMSPIAWAAQELMPMPLSGSDWSLGEL